MPRISERKALIHELQECLKVIVACRSSDFVKTIKDDDDVAEILELLFIVRGHRYLGARSYVFKKHGLANQLWGYSERHFRQEARMNRQSFMKIVHILEQNPIFKSNSRRSQTPVWIQCLITFRRLGCFGNGNSLGANGRCYGFCEGSVVAFVRRVTTAILAIAKDIMKWPNERERQVIKNRFKNDAGINGAIGIIDGTPVIFSQRPAIDGEVFWSRKSVYCTNLQLICDDRGLIRWFLTGWPGSVYDNTVFEKSSISKYPERFFKPGEFLMADSGYALRPHCITPYKHPQTMVPHHQIFSELFSSKRVTIEHVNGQLKNRWACLKGIPTQIKKRSDFKRVNDQIASCCVLYNLLKFLNDEWEFEDDEELENEDEQNVIPENALTDDDAKNLRTAVENYLLDWYYTNHVY